jgi:hypothetical protein
MRDAQVGGKQFLRSRDQSPRWPPIDPYPPLFVGLFVVFWGTAPSTYADWHTNKPSELVDLIEHLGFHPFLFEQAKRILCRPEMAACDRYPHEDPIWESCIGYSIWPNSHPSVWNISGMLILRPRENATKQVGIF